MLLDMFVSGEHTIQGKITIKGLVDGIRNYPGARQLVIAGTRTRTDIKAMSDEIDGPSSQLDNHVSNEADEIIPMSTMFDVDHAPEDEDHIHVYKATSDPDTLYHDEATRAHDADKFREAVSSEWTGQAMNKNFSLMKKSEPHYL